MGYCYDQYNKFLHAYIKQFDPEFLVRLYECSTVPDKGHLWLQLAVDIAKGPSIQHQVHNSITW